MTGATVARLVSVNVGLPRDASWNGRTVHTGIWKQPRPGPHVVRRLNIDGDGQGDLQGHGGEHRAVLVYQTQSYDYWRHQLGRHDLVPGHFGENLTVDGLADDEVCIGDRFRIGTAEFEVTQPRVTCYRVGMRLDRPDIPSLLVSHRRPGFYLRVLTEGTIEAGDDIIRGHAEPHRLSVAAVDALLYLPGRDVDQLRRAVAVPALSPGWQASFRDLLAAESTTAAPDRGPASDRPAWAGFRPLRVVRVAGESGTVRSVYLQDPDGAPLPVAKPGQYLTIRLSGPDGRAAVRNYSLSSAPGATRYRINVKREEHGLVSGLMHATVTAGSTLEVAAPRGEFVLDDSDLPVLLVSAGVGATPVLAMLHQLAATAGARPVWWLHAARSPAEHAFAAEAHTLLAALPEHHEHIFYSRATAAPLPPARIGRLTADALAALGPPRRARAYVCGPPAFMDEIGAGLVALGLDPAAIATERFGPAAAITPGVKAERIAAPHPPAGEPGAGPLVTFARSGLAVPYRADVANVLELAELCDVPTRWACRTGVCHTCETPLLAGRAGYRPDPLDPPSPDRVLICCAQPDTDLVLDL